MSRYDRELEVGGQKYLVSFISEESIQRIIYTRVDGMDAGEFPVKLGWICSRSPHDFILQNEIQNELNHQQSKLVIRY